MMYISNTPPQISHLVIHKHIAIPFYTNCGVEDVTNRKAYIKYEILLASLFDF